MSIAEHINPLKTFDPLQSLCSLFVSCHPIGLTWESRTSGGCKWTSGGVVRTHTNADVCVVQSHYFLIFRHSNIVFKALRSHPGILSMCVILFICSLWNKSGIGDTYVGIRVSLIWGLPVFSLTGFSRHCFNGNLSERGYSLSSKRIQSLYGRLLDWYSMFL